MTPSSVARAGEPGEPFTGFQTTLYPDGGQIVNQPMLNDIYSICNPGV
jgi:hypothetical protein